MCKQDDEATFELWEVPNLHYWPDLNAHGPFDHPSLWADSSRGLRQLGVTVLGIAVGHSLKDTVDELQTAKRVRVRLIPGEAVTHTEKMVFGRKCQINDITYPTQLDAYIMVDDSENAEAIDAKRLALSRTNSYRDHMTIKVLSELRPICVVVRTPIQIFISAIYCDGQTSTQVHYTADAAKAEIAKQIGRYRKDLDVRFDILEGLLQ